MPQNTLKTLGFEKTAASVKGISDAATNILANISKVEKPFAKLLHDITGITTPGHAKRLQHLVDSQQRRLLRRNKKKPEVKKPLFGLKTGLIGGAVGATAAHSIFGDKKRNSPYYPSGY